MKTEEKNNILNISKAHWAWHYVLDFLSSCSDYEKANNPTESDLYAVISFLMIKHKISKNAFCITYQSEDITLKSEFYKAIDITYVEFEDNTKKDLNKKRLLKIEKNHGVEIINFGCINKEGNSIFGFSLDKKNVSILKDKLPINFKQ